MISFAYPTVDRAIASRYLGDGQIAALRYSFYLAQLPPGLLVVTFSLASFPWISDLSVPSAKERLLTLYRQSIGLIVFAMLPIVCGMVIFAPEIVRVAFQRGEFDAMSTQLTSGPFVAYSIGLLFYSVYIYQMRYYYARKLMLRLGIILVVMLAIKVTASLLLVGPLEHRGLALGTTVAWISGLLIMTIDLGKATGLTLARGMSLKLARTLPTAAVTVGFWLALRYFWPIASASTVELVAKLAVHGLVGGLIYFALSHRLGLEEPRRVLAAVRERLKLPGTG
jgi:putative peptidoglycan lipid II flippase